jgi:hypothetical protein
MGSQNRTLLDIPGHGIGFHGYFVVIANSRVSLHPI